MAALNTKKGNKENQMKTNIIVTIFTLVFSSLVHSEEMKVDGLYASWCMTGMATELDGERIPDIATYTFTKDGRLKYDAGFFKQEDTFSIEGEKIKTKSMGNYKIISIKNTKMILYYGGYMFFSRGSCK